MTDPSREPGRIPAVDPLARRFARWRADELKPSRVVRFSVGFGVLLALGLTMLGLVKLSPIESIRQTTDSWSSLPFPRSLEYRLCFALGFTVLQVLILLPGWHVVGLCGVDEIPRRVLHAFVFSGPVVRLFLAIVRPPFTGWADGCPQWDFFDFNVLAILALLTVILLDALVVRRGYTASRFKVPQILLLLVVLFVSSFLCAPKVLAPSLEADAIRSFEASRLAAARLFPGFGADSGVAATFTPPESLVATWHSGTLMSWFGSDPSIARLLFVSSLAACFAAIAALVEQSRGTRIRAIEAATTGAGLSAFGFTMAFAAVEDSPVADLAGPAAPAVFTLAMFLAFVLSFLRHERYLCVALAAAAIGSSPSGLLLVGLFTLSWYAFDPHRSVARIAHAIVGLGLGVAWLCFGSAVLDRLGQWTLAPSRLLLPLGTFVFPDGRGIVWTLVASGFVPILVLLSWRTLSLPVKSLMATAIGTLVYFSIQEPVAVHHFAPAMLLPIAAWAMCRASSTTTGRDLRVALVFMVAALVAAWPKDVASSRLDELFETEIADERGQNCPHYDADYWLSDYERSMPRAFAGAGALSAFFRFIEPTLTSTRRADDLSLLALKAAAKHPLPSRKSERVWPSCLLTQESSLEEMALLVEQGYRRFPTSFEVQLWVRDGAARALSPALQPRASGIAWLYDRARGWRDHGH